LQSLGLFWVLEHDILFPQHFHNAYTSVGPVHNAQVCYFNNVWLMFLVLKKNFSFQTTVGPPPRPGPSHFSLRFFTPSTPPPGPSHFPLRFFNPSIPPAWSYTFPTPVLYPVDPPPARSFTFPTSVL
jgi:hypothetical protein